ncbi:E3 ubiquitin ligase SCF complex subunit SKP1/ASK1family protein [Striga asiatica]|uniref:E3 ubiquitin ligase SCF complex subunit SKP1/ASK1family protein n=1 Tax=Striga asiatica TaxID=4170 RepID=A0A5A7Q1C2_STRAF|nr:E3 ubiquitin ligase SCF complex subunit SKP1/ASK1family protein [Striga asiatica]
MVEKLLRMVFHQKGAGDGVDGDAITLVDEGESSMDCICEGVRSRPLQLLKAYVCLQTCDGSIQQVKEEERKAFNEKFVRMCTKWLCELTSAADSLHLRPLSDITSRTLTRVIEGKSLEEIRYERYSICLMIS